MRQPNQLFDALIVKQTEIYAFKQVQMQLSIHVIDIFVLELYSTHKQNITRQMHEMWYTCSTY
jgi:hypothetical protein